MIGHRGGPGGYLLILRLLYARAIRRIAASAATTSVGVRFAMMERVREESVLQSALLIKH